MTYHQERLPNAAGELYSIFTVATVVALLGFGVVVTYFVG